MWWNFFKREPKPFSEGYLPENDGHLIYYRQFGNPSGLPVLSFHGGPGGSSRPKYAKLFDKNKYRFIQFDQRGCGNSTAENFLKNNNTEATLNDALRLLEHLNITQQVIVHGASWGSTLALLFAEAYPQKISKIIVSSVFLARPYDISWVNSESERFYPDLWAEMRQKVHRKDIYPVYRHLLFSKNYQDNLKALTYLGSYEYMLGRLKPQFKQPETLDMAELNAARIAFYYEEHKYFLSSNQIIQHAAKIKNIPTLIVHNRLDFCCPVKQAWDLHQALPKSRLIINAGSGHSTPRLFEATKQAVFNFLEQK